MIQPVYFAFETPQIMNWYQFLLEQAESGEDYGLPQYVSVTAFQLKTWVLDELNLDVFYVSLPFNVNVIIGKRRVRLIR